MAFVYSSTLKQSQAKIDIIFIPAIGADPRATWARQPERDDHARLDLDICDKLKSTARVHLYDHLTKWERGLKIPPRRDKKPLTESQQALINAFGEAENDVGALGVEDWAERLLTFLQAYRETVNRPRPFIFICHSTGGNVLKYALTKKLGREPNEIARNTLGITFFAVPHHGSSVLSESEYVQTVQTNLGLKWKMSKRLRRDFRLRGDNERLNELNHMFAVDMVGAKIHSYAEMKDTHLMVLISDAIGGEGAAVIRLCIVDSRSGRLGTDQAPIEDEEFVQLDMTHTGLPRFEGQDDQYEIYLEAIGALVGGYNEGERKAYQKLTNTIMSKVEVHVHQFYGDRKSMKILLTKPTLKDFLELGPAEAMKKRIEGHDKDVAIPVEKAGDTERPKIDLQPASEATVPIFKVEAVDADDTSDDHRPSSPPTLSPPYVPVPKSIHTPRPPNPPATTEPGSPGKLVPKQNRTVQAKAVSFKGENKDRDEFFGPHRATPFRLPAQAPYQFRWIHVPFTHPGWVHQVLGRIAREKGSLKLHEQLLMNKMWFSQHNQSRHASPHARFVRPSVKCLLPEGVETKPTDGITTPSSACEDIQFVVYMPYLHWDSFKHMKKRADIIAQRQKQARPIPRDILMSSSIEHKLIWQYLNLDRPLHCRRTLDQYGYPSLRNTSVRDHDQILWKRTKLEVKNSPPPPPKSSAGRHNASNAPSAQQTTSSTEDSHIPKVLMVDQLWLWILDHETVVTFFPGRENDEHTGYSREGDVRSLIYQDINGDYANQCNDPLDFAALAIRHAIKALLEKTNDRNLQVFRIFEEYISILTEQQNSSYKAFRDNQRINATDVETEKHVHNREDLNALLELRDIEDELNTLDKLIKEQQSCVTEMTTQYRSLNTHHAKGLKGIDFLLDIAQFLNEHKVQIDSMRDSAQAAKQAYRDLLDMKQKQANVIEAHLAGRQSMVAANQSRTVMIFTIFTIIFLPLSFFASVFGINSKEWSGNGNNYLPLHNIFTYMLTISLAVIIVALLAAFSKPARKLAMRTWKVIAFPFLKVFKPSSSRGDGGGGTDPGRSGGYGRGFKEDLEKGVVETEGRRKESERLSAISRTQSMHYWDEKFVRDMQKDGVGDGDGGTGLGINGCAVHG